jgi:hypothetical protein
MYGYLVQVLQVVNFSLQDAIFDLGGGSQGVCLRKV